MKILALYACVGLLSATTPAMPQDAAGSADAVSIVQEMALVERYRIEPGTPEERMVQSQDQTPHLIPRVFASFKLVQDNANGYPPIWREVPGQDPDQEPEYVHGVTGGGCLMFQPRHTPPHCSAHATASCPQIQGYKSQNLTGECVNSGGSNTCWYRRNESACDKSPQDFLVVDQPHEVSVDANPLRGEQVRWLLVTCQNIFERACASPVRIVQGVHLKSTASEEFSP